MCTVKMTFEVPETRHINIEQLKQKINAYVMHLISIPSIEQTAGKLDKNWRTWVIEPELLDIVSGTSKAKFSDSDPYYKGAITQAMEERYEGLS